MTSPSHPPTEKHQAAPSRQPPPLDYAYAKKDPHWPKIVKWSIIATIIGLALGIGLSVLHEILSPY